MSGSISYWLSQLKQGNSDAATELWVRYSNDITELCRKRLSRIPKSFVDEDDIAQSAFRCICEGLMEGQLISVTSRDDLWFLLLSITFKKIASHVESEMAQKRGGGKVRTESSIAMSSDETARFRIDWLASDEPTPDLSVMLQEQHVYLLEKLGNERLRTLAELRIAGFSVSEIAHEMSLSTRSVERKLSLIRDKWRAELCEVH
jgi:DNA-directed RNA polymerase specialized sigma24 family protein